MNRKLLSIFLAALAAPLIATSLSGAAPTNFVKNGDFSQGLAHWGDFEAAKTTFTITPGGAASFQAKSPSAAGSTYIGASQCLQVPSDQQPYQVTTDLFIPANQARRGLGRIRVTSFANTLCQGWLDEEEKFIYATGSQQVTFPALVPPGTKSFRISIGVESYDATAGEDPSVAFRAEWDNVAIVGEGPSPVSPTATPTATPTTTPTPTATPALPELPNFPAPGPSFPVLQDPIDIVIPGPLGSAPDPVKPSEPSLPEQPLQPAKPETPSRPSQPAEPKAGQPQADVPAAQPETAAAAAAETPLPPSSGSGLAADSSQPLMALLAGACLALAGAFTTTAAAARRR